MSCSSRVFVYAALVFIVTFVMALYGYMPGLALVALAASIVILLVHAASVLREENSRRCLAACTCLNAWEEGGAVLSLLKTPLAVAASAALTIYTVDDIVRSFFGPQLYDREYVKLRLAAATAAVLFLATLVYVLLRDQLSGLKSRNCSYVEKNSMNTVVVTEQPQSAGEYVRATLELCCRSNRVAAARRTVLALAVVVASLPGYALAFYAGAKSPGSVLELPKIAAVLLAALPPIVALLSGGARSAILDKLAPLLGEHKRGSIYLLPKEPDKWGIVQLPAQQDVRGYKELMDSLRQAIRQAEPPLAVFFDPHLQGIVGYIAGYMVRALRPGVGLVVPVAVYKTIEAESMPEYIIGDHQGLVACCEAASGRQGPLYRVEIGFTELSRNTALVFDSIKKKEFVTTARLEGIHINQVTKEIANLLSSRCVSGCRVRLLVLAQATRDPRIIHERDVVQLRSYGATHLLWIRILPQERGVLRKTDHLNAAYIIRSVVSMLLRELGGSGADAKTVKIELWGVVPAMSVFTGFALGHFMAVLRHRLVCGYSLYTRRYSCVRLA